MPTSMRIQCSYCRKMKQPDGTYKHEEGFDAKTPDLSHGICPDCLKIERAKYRNRKKYYE